MTTTGGTKPSFTGAALQSEFDSLLQELEGIDLSPATPGDRPGAAPAASSEGPGRAGRQSSQKTTGDSLEFDMDDLAELADALRPPEPPPRPAEPPAREPPPAPPRSPLPADPRTFGMRPPEPKPPAVGGADPRRVAALEQEVEAWRSKAVRAASELDGARKRLAKEKQDALQFANEALVRDLLPAMDSLYLATTHARPEGFDELLAGVSMTQTLLLQVLARHGVEAFDPMGQPFDPRLHQALSRVTAPDSPPGTVLSTGQRGFTLQGRLLRPALVTVAGAPAEPTPEPEEPAPVAFETARRRSVPTNDLGGRVGSDEARERPMAVEPTPASEPNPFASVDFSALLEETVR